MAPSVMTSGDPAQPKLLPVYTAPSGPICSKSTRPIFAFFSPAGKLIGVDD